MSRTGGGRFQQGAGHGPSFVQDLTVRGDLTVDGNAVFLHTDTHTIAGNLTVDGDFTVNGTSTVLDTATVEVEDAFVELGHGTEALEGGLTLANSTRLGRLSIHNAASAFGVNGLSVQIPALSAAQQMGLLVGAPTVSVNLQVGSGSSIDDAVYVVDQSLSLSSAPTFGGLTTTGTLDVDGYAQFHANVHILGDVTVVGTMQPKITPTNLSLLPGFTAGADPCVYRKGADGIVQVILSETFSSTAVPSGGIAQAFATGLPLPVRWTGAGGLIHQSGGDTVACSVNVTTAGILELVVASGWPILTPISEIWVSLNYLAAAP